jgi:hypothetical protein
VIGPERALCATDEQEPPGELHHEQAAKQDDKQGEDQRGQHYR